MSDPQTQDHSEDCEDIECTCDIRKLHDVDCLFRIAACCAIPVACDDHGRDCCPECDPCTCDWAARDREPQP